MPEPKAPDKPPAGKGPKAAGARGGKPSPASKPAGGLNKKVGGLPLWAWGGLVLAAVGIGLYFRSRSGGASTATAQPDTSGQTAAGTGDVGGGTGSASPDLTDLEGSISDLVNALGSGTVSVPGDVNVPPGSEATAPPATANGFWWGNTFFTSKPKWEAWAKTHGINLPQWYANHPNAARSIGVTPPPPRPASGARAAKATTTQSKPQKATVNTAHPTPTHPAAAAVHVAVAAPAQAKPKAATSKPKTAKPAAAPAHHQPA